MLLNSVWKFSTAGQIAFGRGCRSTLEEQIRRRGLLRPFVVADSTLLSLSPIGELVAQLRASFDLAVFEGGVPEPSVEVAIEACGRAAEHRADCVVGIGGGSNLDIAKVVAVVAKHGGRPQDYFGFDCVPGPTLPHFALPTTAGTGSEVSHSAVLTDTEAGTKVSTLSPWLRPASAIVDPELTDSCPRRVTAESGIDALVHAVEALSNKDYSLMLGVDPQARAYEGSYGLTSMLASRAIALCGQWLVRAVEEPSHKQARDAMAEAALLAGMAFSNSGVGIVHALEYPIGALTHCSHGEGNGLLLPHVMRFNRDACREQYSAVYNLLSPCSQQLHSSPDSVLEASEMAIEAVVELQKAIGIRRHLGDLGVLPEHLPSLAAKSFGIKRLMDINAKPVSLADLEHILRAAM